MPPGVLAPPQAMQYRMHIPCQSLLPTQCSWISTNMTGYTSHSSRRKGKNQATCIMSVHQHVHNHAFLQLWRARNRKGRLDTLHYSLALMHVTLYMSIYTSHACHMSTYIYMSSCHMSTNIYMSHVHLYLHVTMSHVHLYLHVTCMYKTVVITSIQTLLLQQQQQRPTSVVQRWWTSGAPFPSLADWVCLPGSRSGREGDRTDQLDQLQSLGGCWSTSVERMGARRPRGQTA